MRRLRSFAIVYAALLVLSYGVRALRPPRAPSPPRNTTTLADVRGTQATGRRLTVGWFEWPPAPGAPSAAHSVLLLHGSPGDAGTFGRFGPALAERGFRVIAPDLPGFGASGEPSDYSIRAHAAVVAQLLDQLELDQRAVHVVGFSMGGGVALEMVRQDPARVASLVLLSSIGVQELELLGDYHLNHFVHGAQLAALLALHHAVPHFGLLDDVMLDVAYGRNFFDTDQRPLRAVLAQLLVPTLVLHGEGDPLVPAAAALEHHRIVPHSELVMRGDSHFFVFSRDQAASAAHTVAEFLDRVERAQAATRAQASAERIAAARQPFASQTRWEGAALLAVVLLLAVATLVSEDLACLGAGLLVAQGRLGLLAALFGCGLGIVVGDFSLFWLGRVFGRPALRYPPLRYWLTEQRLEHSSAWLRRHGPAVILMSRFMPGARLPTYVAAGILRTSFWSFAAYFVLAVAAWTPAIVLLSAKLGAAALERLQGVQYAVWLVALGLVALLVLVRVVALPMTTHHGRRRLLGRFLRWRHYEFWPPWLFYPPVILYILWLGIRHRGLTLFTAANPAIPAGGFVGESKAEIYRALEPSGVLPRWCEIPPHLENGEKVATAAALAERVGYPIVLKPDAGQRGSGVAIVRSRAEIERYFAHPRPAALAQEFAPGHEFGIFYVRRPHEERGRIFSITDKRPPVVNGDGIRTLEELVLDDPRAVAIHRVYTDQLGARARSVPAAGEQVVLAEVGAHCRGTIFYDGAHLVTPELEAAIDRISGALPGFDIGRYDVRAPDAEALRRGGPLRVIELNGITSEATNLYDRRHSLLGAYRILFAQWRVAFEIAAVRRRAGHRPVSALDLLRRWRQYAAQRASAG